MINKCWNGPGAIIALSLLCVMFWRPPLSANETHGYVRIDLLDKCGAKGPLVVALTEASTGRRVTTASKAPVTLSLPQGIYDGSATSKHCRGWFQFAVAAGTERDVAVLLEPFNATDTPDTYVVRHDAVVVQIPMKGMAADLYQAGRQIGPSWASRYYAFFDYVRGGSVSIKVAGANFTIKSTLHTGSDFHVYIVHPGLSHAKRIQ